MKTGGGIRYFENRTGTVHLSIAAVLCGKVAKGTLQELCAAPKRRAVCRRCLRKLRLLRQSAPVSG